MISTLAEVVEFTRGYFGKRNITISALISNQNFKFAMKIILKKYFFDLEIIGQGFYNRIATIDRTATVHVLLFTAEAIRIKRFTSLWGKIN